MRDASSVAYINTSGETEQADARRLSADERACCGRAAEVYELCARVARGAACMPLLVTAVFTSASNAERNGTGELRPLLFSQRWCKGAGGKA